MRRSLTAAGVPSRARRRRLALIPALCGGCVLVLVSWARPAGESTLRGAGASWQSVALVSSHSESAFASSARPKSFQIAGAIKDLYPGSSATLTLTVRNLQRFTIVVTRLSTTVGSPAPGCHATNLTVATFSGQLTVRARASRQLSVPVTFSRAAPDACQGARFPLEYSGLAKKG